MGFTISRQKLSLIANTEARYRGPFTFWYDQSNFDNQEEFCQFSYKHCYRILLPR